MRQKLPPDVDGWGYSLRWMMGFVVAFGGLIIVLREYLERSVAKKQAAAAPKKKKKTQMGVAESFTFLANSTYIRCMATLVVCYGICINLVEVTWKSKLKVCSCFVWQSIATSLLALLLSCLLHLLLYSSSVLTHVVDAIFFASLVHV